MAWLRQKNNKHGILNLRTSVSGLTTWVEVCTPEKGWRRLETKFTVDEIFDIIKKETDSNGMG